MSITIHELDGGVTRVVLAGRIDIKGAQEIDTPLSVIGGSRRALVIDLTEVEFLASIGLRSLVQCAKVVQLKGGKVVLLSPRPVVAEVIQFSGIDELIPIHDDADEAIAAVSPAR